MRIRLAIGNADRIIFALGACFLTYYQVPHTVFYVYILVVGFTEFLQLLKHVSRLRLVFLEAFCLLTGGKSEEFLLRYTSLHCRNPFTRCFTKSPVSYIPVGSTRPTYQTICHFQLKNPDDFDAGAHHELTVGDRRLIIKTVCGGIEEGTEDNIRSSNMEAPWEVDRVTFEMSNENLGRLKGY